MKTDHSKMGHTLTPFIHLNTHQCHACWLCLDNCPEKVFGKIKLPGHKHVIFRNPQNCSGCRKCIKGCQYSALSALNNI